MKRRTRPALAALALLLLASGAEAHGSVQGLGNFFGGAVHPLLEPAHLIALIGLGLLVAQYGEKALRPALAGLALGAAAGLVAAALQWATATDPPLLAWAALAGLLIAASRRLPLPAYACMGAFVGLGIGLASAPESGTVTARVVSLAGTAFGICAWVVMLAVWLIEWKGPRLAILVRVVGSWVAASAMLVLALALAGRAKLGA